MNFRSTLRYSCDKDKNTCLPSAKKTADCYLT